MLEYSALFEPDREAGGYVVTFADISEAITQGDTEEEAMENAADVLALALATYMDRERSIPIPRRLRGKHYRTVRLPVLSEAKISLYIAMRGAGVRRAELARQLRCAKSEVDRLLDLGHASRLDQIENALRVLGKRLVLSLEDAA